MNQCAPFKARSRQHSTSNGDLPSSGWPSGLGRSQGSTVVYPRCVKNYPCRRYTFLRLVGISCVPDTTRSCAHTNLSSVWRCCAGGQLKLSGSSKSVHRLSRASTRYSGLRPLAADASDGVGGDKRVRFASGLEEEVRFCRSQKGHLILELKLRQVIMWRGWGDCCYRGRLLAPKEHIRKHSSTPISAHIAGFDWWR